jgi:hypothetical protein
MARDDGGTLRAWIALRWRPVTAVAAGVLLIGGITGYVVNDDRTPATKVLSGTFTQPTTTIAPDAASPQATTTTLAPLAQTTGTAAPKPAGPTTTVRASTVTTRAPVTSSAPCRNSTDPSCGPFRWDGAVVNQGMTLELRWSPANPEIGQTVTFTLTVSDPDAPADGFFQLYGFGDGPGLAADDLPDECNRYGLWSLPAPKPGRWVDTYTYTYSRSGTFQAWFTRSSRTPDLPGCVDEARKLGDPWASSATITATIAVAPPSPARSVWTQSSDNVMSFEYRSVGQRSGASSTSLDSGSHILLFTVDGQVISDSPATARLRVSLRNQRDFTVTFPGGVDVVIDISRNGQPWQDVHLRDAGLTTLAPGQVTELTGTVVLPGFGVYEVQGDVTYLGS